VKTIAILCGVLLFALLLGACESHTERPPDAQRLIEQGQVVYWQYCAECHQADGSGWSHLYPRLAGNPIVTLHDPVPLIVTVVYGMETMPAFRDRLTTDQIASVLTYIRNAWGNEAAAVSARQIK
jgi:alcohol dehydrogenase (quinone), cytochrome c subunit